METDTLVLLAGGLATRLRPLTEKTPKSMIEVAGYPFIHHQMQLLKSKGIKRVIICAGVMGEQIEDYVSSGENYGLEIKFNYDGEKLLGTGGAVKKVLKVLPENFFIMYGDSYLDTDFKVINEYFFKKKKAGLMTVFRNEGKWDRSNIVFVNGEILLYDKKRDSGNMKYIDYGLGILTQKAFNDVIEEEVFDLETVYQKLLKKNELAGFEIRERFYEIGSMDGIKEAEKFLKRKGN